MAEVKFDITGDNKNFVLAMKGAEDKVKQAQKTVETSGASIEKTFERIKKAAEVAFLGFSAKEFVSEVAKVRGEYQKLEVAFKTMLGDKQKADAFMEEVSKMALTTPFSVQDVANSAKQLLAYGTAAEDVTGVLTRLGDIASGLSVNIDSVVSAYGRVQVMGKMTSRVFMQLQSMGVPIAKELAQEFGVAQSEVSGLITAGKVTAEKFNAAIESMAGEGSQFGGLMEAQAKTIAGQMSNFGIAIEEMFNKIGKANEDTISSVIEKATELVDNYEQVGRIIAGLVATYGIYKAAVATVTTIQALQTAGVAALTTAETVHYGVINLVQKAQALLNKTMLANPYVLLATAVAGVIAVLVSMKTATERLKDAEEEYNKKKEETIKKEEEHKRKIEELCAAAGDEQLSTENRRIALHKLIEKYPEIFKKYDTELAMLKDIKKIKEEIAELDAKGSITNPQNELNDVNKQIEALEKKREAAKGESKAGGGFIDKLAGGVHERLEFTAKDQADLQNLYNTRNKLTGQVKKQAADEYLANLTGVSNDALEDEITRRKNLLFSLRDKGENSYGKVTGGGAQGTFSKNELQAQLKILEMEQNNRNAPKTNYSKQVSEARAELDAANKALADFKNSAVELTEQEFNDQLKVLTDNVQEAQNKYNNLVGSQKKGSSSSSADTLAKDTERYNQLLDDSAKEAKRNAIDLELSTRQAIIDQQEDSNEKTLAQIQLDFDKQKEEITRGYEDLAAAKIENARKLFEANPANKDKVFDASTVDTSYTAEETANYEAQLKAAEKTRDNSIKEVQDAETQIWRDLLKQYGSYEEKKLAITQEYADKIAKANETGSMADVTKLTLERDNALKDLDNKFGEQVNWEAVFSGLSDYSTAYLKQLRDQLRDAMNSKDTTPEMFATYAKQYEKLNEEIEKGSSSWAAALGLVSQRHEHIKQLMQDEQAAQDALTDARQHLTNAQTTADTTESTLTNMLRMQGLDKSSYYDAGGKLSMNALPDIQQSMQDKGISSDSALGKYIQDLINQLIAQKAAIADWEKTVKDAENNFEATEKKTEGARELTPEEKKQRALETADKVAANASSAKDLANSIFGEDSDTGQKFSQLADGVNSSIDAFKDFESGNYVGAATSALSAIDSFGQALGIFGETDKTLHDDMEQLSYTNDALAAAIDKLADDLSDYSKSVIDSAQSYEEAVKDLKESETGMQDIMGRAGANHQTGLMSSDHSSNHYINKAMTKYDWQKVSEAAGRTVTSASDFWTLTSEQMANVAEHAAAQYAVIKKNAAEGHEDVSQYMDDYISYAEQLDDLTDQWYQRLTQTTFDDVYNNFLSSIMDMSHTTQDFADDFEDMMKQAVASAFLSSAYGDLIQNFYDDFAAAMGNGGQLNESELKALKANYMDMAETASEELKDLYEMLGLSTSDSYSQSASSGTWQSMSEDTGQELNGRFTALQESNQEILNLTSVISADLTEMLSYAVALANVSDEVRTIIANSYLELQEINDNTGRTAQYLKVIQADIADVKEYTSRL